MCTELLEILLEMEIDHIEMHGEQKKAEETATKMLRKEYPASDISELTGLTLEKVLELQKSITVEV